MNTVNGIDIEASVEVEATVAADPRTIYGHLRYQECAPATCLMPVAQPVEVKLEI